MQYAYVDLSNWSRQADIEQCLVSRPADMLIRAPAPSVSIGFQCLWISEAQIIAVNIGFVDITC